MVADNGRLNIGCDSSYASMRMQLGSGAYHIVQVVWGFGAVRVAGQFHSIQTGSILLLPPREKVEWYLGHDAGIHYCSIHPAYFRGHSHVQRSFADYFMKHGVTMLQQLPCGQVAAFSLLFRLILLEVNGVEDDKKAAILIHLQMLLLLAGRVYRLSRKGPSLPAAGNITRP